MMSEADKSSLRRSISARCSVCQLQVKRIMNRYFELGSPIAKYAYVGASTTQHVHNDKVPQLYRRR